MIDNLPKRSYTKYTEIDNFKEYELTRSLIYEFAIRDNDVKDILTKLNKIRNNIFDSYAYNREYNKILLINESKNDDLYMHVDILEYLKNKKEPLENLENEIIKLNESKSYKGSMGFTDYGDIERLYSLFNQFKSKYIEIKNDLKSGIELTKELLFNIPELEKSFKEFNILYYRLKNEYYLDYLDIAYSKNTRARNAIKQLNNLESMTHNINGEESIRFNNKLNTSYNTRILPSFSRPIILDKRNENIIDINIDLNLPVKETQKYLEEIINNFKKHPELIKKGNNIEKTLSIPNNYIKNKDKRMDSLSNKWADWLYSYDYYKVYNENNKKLSDSKVFQLIDLELKSFHDIEDTYNYWYEESVYKKNIIPLMTSLIDNYEYINLLKSNLNK